MSPSQQVRHSTGQKDRIGIEDYNMVTPFVQAQAKSITQKWFKDISPSRDFMSLVIKENSPKLASNTYSPRYKNDLKTEPKEIRFGMCKAARKTITEEFAGRRSFIPGAEAYSPKQYHKILGNTKT